MRLQRRDQRGDTLIEIIFAVVIMGIVVSALFASFATASTASKAGRDYVTADAVLRNFAEATKAAVRTSCTAPGATFSVNYPSLIPAGSGITTTNTNANQSCPPVTGSPAAQAPTINFTVSVPNGAHTQRTLSIAVRTP